MDVGRIYAEARVRIAELVGGLPDDEVTRPVPGCPGWTVHDVVAHLAGLVTDVAEGRWEGAGTPPWTARQVEERRERSVAELLDEWERGAGGVEGMLSASKPGAMQRPALDVLTHEHDIREALGLPPPEPTPALDWAAQNFAFGLDRTIKARGAPALRVVAGNQEWELGEGEPAATVRLTPYELLRATAGRRTKAQIRAYEWDGDPEPYLDALNVFGVPLPEGA